jgi:hypothetical protein
LAAASDADSTDAHSLLLLLMHALASDAQLLLFPLLLLLLLLPAPASDAQLLRLPRCCSCCCLCLHPMHQ